MATPPSVLIKDAKVSTEWKHFQFRIHDFANLSTTKYHYVASQKFTCNGHQWELWFYPGGDYQSAEGQVSVFLYNRSQGTITVRFGVKVIDKFGNKMKSSSSKKKFTTNYRWGWKDFISRSVILDESKNILDDKGALIVAVSIEEDPTTVFVPQNPLVKMVKDKFNDQTTADVCFEVSSSEEKEDDDGKNKRVKTTTSFHAHRLILEMCAPMLAAICGSNENGGVVTASINDIKPEIFHHLLSYVYGRTIPEDDFNTHAKDIIAAADKYSIVNLKLAAEAAYVKSSKITFDNVMDDLLYADSRNCALLKEAAMDFLAENSVEATEKASFANFPAHLLKDVFVAMNKAHGKSGGDAFAAMSVSELRKKLDEKGLEVDGSREAMIESIKSHS